MPENYLKNLYGKKATKEMLQVNPHMVVIHSMALGNLKKSLSDSGFLHKKSWARISKWGSLPVGVHFIIETDGTIFIV